MMRPSNTPIPLFEVPRPASPTEGGEHDADWWDLAVAGVRHLAATGMAFQAYDLVRAGVPEPARGAHRWGALFTSLHRQGLIVPIGYGPSPRPTTRSSAARIWRGAR